MYVHVCAHVFAHVCVCVSEQVVCRYVHVHVCVRLCVYVLCVCVCVCVCVCACVRVHVCAYMDMFESDVRICLYTSVREYGFVSLTAAVLAFPALASRLFSAHVYVYVNVCMRVRVCSM